MSAKTLPAAPYAGLRPYSEDDAPFFFGRESVGQTLTDNLRAKRLTLVYGASGVGKSSVLRAGVQYHLHRLAQENLELKGTPQFAVAVFQEWREWRDDPIAGLRDCVRNAVRRVLGDPAVEIAPSTSLGESFRGLARRVGGDLLIILDQFEDYFLGSPAQPTGDGTFGSEFQRLVNSPDLRVNFLLSIREDAYSKLECFKDDISGIYDNSLEIDHLDTEAARRAIQRPIEEYNRFYAAGNEQIAIEPELVEKVLSQTRTGNLSMGETPSPIKDEIQKSKAESTIETPFLQLVMTALWKAEMSKGSRILRCQTLDDLGGAEKIVQTHLEQALSKLSESEKALAASAFGDLVTPSYDKRAYTAFDIAGAADLNEGQLTALLEKLSRGNNRILRSFALLDGKGESSYEIFHDVLARPILDWRRRYKEDQRSNEEKLKADEELAATMRKAEEDRKLAEATARADEQAKVAAALRWKNRALALATTAAVIAAFFALWQYVRAERARRQAVIAGNVHSDVLGRLYQAAIPADQEAARQALVQIANSLSEQREEYQQDGNPIGEGITLNNIAGIYREVGRSYNGAQDYEAAQDYYQQACASYEEAKTILGRVPGGNQSDVATSLHDAGMVYIFLGKYSEAEQPFERALSILESALGSDSSYVADAVVSLAHCYSLQGKYGKAEARYKDALEIRRKQLRPDHPKLAASLYYLGSIYFAQGKLAKAEPLFKNAGAIWQAAPEPQRSNASPSLYGLAAIYRELGILDEAEKYLEQGRQAQEKLFERDDLLSARYIDNLALLYDARNDPKTEAAFLNAHEIKVHALGDKHPDTAYSAARLASFYQRSGNQIEAEKYFNNAREVQQALPSSPDLARTLSGLARLYAGQVKYAEAEPLFKQALAIQETAIPGHPDFADTLDSYADLLDKIDRHADAEKMRNRAKRIRQIHSEENPVS